MKKIHIAISFLFSLKIKIAGLVKKDIHRILNAYVPIKDINCIISRLLEKLYAIKFQGKPVSKFPLKNSNIENIKEKIKINESFFSAKGPTKNITIPKNNDKNIGISTNAIGIKTLNDSSWVKDIVIQ